MPCHRKNLQEKSVEKMGPGPNRRWDLLRRLLFPDLAWLGLNSGLLCVYNARELGGVIIGSFLLGSSGG